MALLAPLAGAEPHANLLSAASAHGALSERACHLFLSRLFATKQFAEFNDYCADETLGFDTLRAYHRVRLQQHSASKDLTFEAVLRDYRAAEMRSLATKPMLYVLIAQAIREEKTGFLENWIDTATDAQLCAVPKATQFGIAACLLQNEHASTCRSYLARILPHIPAENKLGLFTAAKAAFGPGYQPEIQTQNDVLDCYELIWADQSPPLEDNLRTHVLAQYRPIIGTAKRSFMDIRIDPAKAQELLQLIEDSLVKKEPFSFVRLGDGEAYRLPPPEISGITAAQFTSDDRLRETAFWGKQLPHDVGIQVFQRNLEAFQCADLLGVPSAFRFVRDAAFSRNYGSATTDRSMLALFAALGSLIPLRDIVITEERAHTLLFSKQTLESLMQKAGNTIFVGCWTAVDLPLLAENQASILTVEPENKLQISVATGALSIIDDYETISREVAALTRPGTLALISTGYAGKALCKTVRDNGGVALDIGAVSDSLAGYHSRGLADMVIPQRPA